MKLDHTPGPWNFDNGLSNLICNERERVICDPFEFNKDDLKTNEANARLIAAAPEMIEMLYVCFLVMKSEGIEGYSSMIKSIIESATGKKIEEVL